jgi:superoxide dismutase, Cu-Zn family
MKPRALPAACVLLSLAACGGAAHTPAHEPVYTPAPAEPEQAAPEQAEASPADDPVLAAEHDPEAGNAEQPATAAGTEQPVEGESYDHTPAQSGVETAPTEPMQPTAEPVVGLRAVAEMKPIRGSSPTGSVTFEQNGTTVRMRVEMSGLKKGEHGVAIYEKGVCGNRGREAGKHFNPTNVAHGPRDSGTRHAGDFGNVEADGAGAGVLEVATDSITIVEGGPSSVLGLAIMIHKQADNGSSQPDGKAGPAIACGVITKAP